jgi:uncharacterized membrane protein
LLDEKSKDEMMKGAARRRTLALAIVGIVAFVLLLLLSPLWPLAFLDKLDVTGSAICGRIPDHSFHFAGRQLPLCARCTGTFIGALLGFIGLLALGKRKTAKMPPPAVVALLVGFIFLMAVDGANSYLTLLLGRPLLYEPHNLLRLATGALHGLALSIIVFPIFNFTLWKEPDNGPALAGFRELGLILLLLVLPMILLVQAEPGMLLYPVAILSISGVLGMLTVVNSMIVIIATRREAQAVSCWDAALPVALGFAGTMLELTIIALLRWQFTAALGIPF